MMKFTRVIPLAVLAAVGIGMSATSSMADSIKRVDVTVTTDPALTSLAENSMVMLSGRLEAKDGNALILNAPNGMVRVQTREYRPWFWQQVGDKKDQLSIGDRLTVYGHVRSLGDGTMAVQTHGLTDNDTGKFFLLSGDDDTIITKDKLPRTDLYIPLGS